ncbi:DALR anticodon-binding domain-containing protein [Streptomyces sp. NBC_00873]|uniref:ArgS-related anticodon-binding protein NrtL n=1 Tax=Streptomyces sp. NBC_00873 TaxID=2975852 RepID=UPI003868D115|nr:DALR anticodon-binding domain-containing protein [Streptomyces sp. NBC_00873]
MTPADLSRTVLHAVRRAVDEDVLRAPVPARVRVERTRPGGTGDYACAVALQLAGPAARPAREVAEILRDRVAGAPGIGRVDVTGPGFLSFTLDASADVRAREELVREVLARGARYGHGDALAGDALRLRHAREVRAAVIAHAVGAIARTQGVAVRTGCDAAPDPEWARLGVSVEGPGEPHAPVSAVRSVSGPQAPITAVRPVPAGAGAGELLRRLGPDATRWGLLRPAGHDHAPLGAELLVQGNGNPLFLVRYAHSRVCALTRGAALLGFTGTYDEDVDAPALLRTLADYPQALAAAARHRAPDRLARQLEEMAHAFFDFHDACPPLPMGDEKPSAAHRSRLAVAEAAGTVLAGGLSLLGISAPEVL